MENNLKLFIKAEGMKTFWKNTVAKITVKKKNQAERNTHTRIFQ